MKKAFASIIILVYLAFSCGVIINFHYCMGHLDSVKLFAAKTNLCGTCGMHLGKTHKCCGDEAKLIKLQDDQQKTQVVHSLQAPDVAITVPSDFIVTSFHNNNESVHQQDHSPPLIAGQDTYLQNCVFRI
jgi:hypothetical protein